MATKALPAGAAGAATRPHAHQHAFDGVPNFRDLGGHPTRDGRVVAKGRLFRSAKFSFASDADAQRMGDLVDCLIDFRDPSEVHHSHSEAQRRVESVFVPSDRGCMPKRGAKVSYRLPLVPVSALAKEVTRSATWFETLLLVITHVFCLKRLQERVFRRVFVRHTLAWFYLFLIEHGKHCICDALKLITLHLQRNNTVCFHCSHGKDRTGIIAALVQHVLGVDDNSIVAEYAVSERLLPPSFTHDVLQRGFAEEWARSPAPVIVEAIEFIKQRFGTVDGYLDHIGFSAYWRDELRRSLLESK
jgi:protein tyrosine/serine phosphatase